MAVHPLRPATYHRLGKPSPYQPANRTQSSRTASLFMGQPCGQPIVSGLASRFQLLSRSIRQVLYALLTRPPWLPRRKRRFPIDLHVLSILSAFILSQDQTLHSISLLTFYLHSYDSPSFFFPLIYMSSIVLTSHSRS